MKLTLIISVCLFIGTPLFIVLASLCYTSFMLITGRMTKQQLADKVAKDKARKKDERKFKLKSGRPSGSLPGVVRRALGSPF